MPRGGGPGGVFLALSGGFSAAEEAKWSKRSSAEEIRLLTNRRGKQRAGQQQEEAERACASLAAIAPRAEQAQQPMLVGLDGGWVCSREQRGGMEEKVGVVCSQVEDLPMPTYSTTFSWSDLPLLS
jgi:hypothetical protein